MRQTLWEVKINFILYKYNKKPLITEGLLYNISKKYVD